MWCLLFLVAVLYQGAQSKFALSVTFTPMGDNSDEFTCLIAMNLRSNGAYLLEAAPAGTELDLLWITSPKSTSAWSRGAMKDVGAGHCFRLTDAGRPSIGWVRGL